MTIFTLFLLVILAALVAFYIAKPFVSRAQTGRGVDQELSALMAERDRVLAAIQELDFDLTLGKVAEDEYPAQRQALVQRGAEVLRLLDARSGNQKKPLQANSPVTKTDDDLEDLIAERRSRRKEKTGGFCPKCGKPVQLSDRFCPKCGHALS